MTVELTRAYYVKGASPKFARFRYHIKEPPTAGEQFAFVEDLGGNRCRLFCPFTLRGWTIPRDAGEIARGKGFDIDAPRWIRLIRENWRTFHSLSIRCDLATTAVILRELGGEPPDLRHVARKRRRPGPRGQDDSGRKPRSNGKPIDTAKLSPIKPTGRRAGVARFFLATSSILACMAELDLTRSGVLSHLYCINRDHGLGYELAGGNAAVLLVPDGHEVFKPGD